MPKRPEEIARLVAEGGVDHAASTLGIKRETVRREMRKVKTEKGGGFDQQAAVLKQLTARFTPEELRLIASGGRLRPEAGERASYSFDGEEVVVGFCTDTHMGSKYFPEEYWDAFLAECEVQNVDMILHAGDLCEGMSNRPDQVYSLTHIGASAQMDYAEELLGRTSRPVYIIDGNHDRWAIKSGGTMMVKDVARRLPHVHYLGHDEGDVVINGAIWRLWHGEDGSSYATSYRVQQIIGSFTGGEKPAVLLAGHTHKQAYIFERNIHAVSGGALCRQSAWMRSKRLPNHAGFHIIRATIKDGEVRRFSPTWYPFYS